MRAEMSDKEGVMILLGEDWSLWRECDGKVYLHLDRPGEVDFNCSQHHIKANIPVRVLRAILDDMDGMKEQLEIASSDAVEWARLEDEGEDNGDGAA